VQNFDLDEPRGELIVGRAPIGRVTVRILNMVSRPGFFSGGVV
jgi:hypothetical protein